MNTINWNEKIEQQGGEVDKFDVSRKIDDMMDEFEETIEIFNVIVDQIRKVYYKKEKDLGNRVLDISVIYKNYKTGTREEYSKRFKNGNGEVKEKEVETTA